MKRTRRAPTSPIVKRIMAKYDRLKQINPAAAREFDRRVDEIYEREVLRAATLSKRPKPS
jgi:hypothetical protein